MRGFIRGFLGIAAFAFSLTSFAASFEGIGTLTGGTGSVPACISGDGSSVVGQAQLGSGRAFTWTHDDGMTNLGLLPTWSLSEARGASFDGSVVVGFSGGIGGIVGNGHAFSWTLASGMVDLGTLPGGASSGANAVNADGSVIVGGGGGHAFRWTSSSGMADLGVLDGGSTSSAQGVSSDGATVTGIGVVAGSLRAFRWTAGTGMQNLGTLPGGETTLGLGSQGLAISADGSTITGLSASSQGDQAFRWTLAGGMVGLGFLASDTSSVGNGSSATGSIIVGQSGETGIYGVGVDSSAFIWDSDSGMRNLQSVLTTDYGLGAALTGWQLQSAVAISANGMTIAGIGLDNGVLEGWVATVPEPSTWAMVAAGAGFLAALRRRNASPSKP